MGNAAATLAISLDQEAAYSGGSLSGRAYLYVKEEIKCTALQLEVFGAEFSHVHWTTQETHGSGENRKTVTKHHHAYARRHLLRVVVTLASFPNGSLPPGSYEFPFSLVLPSGLPSSMYAAGGGGSCKISYSVKARLYRREWHKFDIRAKRPLLVSAAPFPPEPVPYFASPHTVPINTFCCIPNGTITLGAVADDTRLSRGETFGVGVAVDNSSTAQINSVSVKVKEFVSWRAGGHSNHEWRTVVAASFDPLTLQGAAKKASADIKAAASPGEARDAVLHRLYETLHSGSQRSSLAIPPTARDTYQGSVLSVRHRMLLRATTGCCVTDPELDLPVCIGPPPLLGGGPAGYPAVPMGVPVVALPVPIPPEEEAASAQSFTKPDGWDGHVVIAEAVVLPMGEAVVGGEAVASGVDPAGDVSEAIAVPESAPPPPPGTLQALRHLFDTNVDDRRMVRGLVQDPAQQPLWQPLLSALTVEQYAECVGRTGLEYDRPEVASLLGEQLASGLTSAHVAAALRTTTAYKTQLVRRVARQVVDLAAGRRTIEAELSEWERMLARTDLDAASK